jgi:preprotein translocase subunit SecF
VIQRIAATVVATLLLWFVWWFFGGLFLTWLQFRLPIGIGPLIAGGVFWGVVVAIPPLLWFRFRHVQENPDR